MSKVSFGVFDWIDRGTQPLSQLYEDRLQLLAAADEAGFFCYHLAAGGSPIKRSALRLR
jgi:hypothetical protein